MCLGVDDDGEDEVFIFCENEGVELACEVLHEFTWLTEPICIMMVLQVVPIDVVGVGLKVHLVKHFDSQSACLALINHLLSD